MSALFASLSLPLLWAQAPAAAPSGLTRRLFATLAWMIAYGDPSVTVNRWWGGPLAWLKVLGLFCLLGWVGAWVVTALKERVVGRGGALDIAALVALIGVPIAVLVHVLQSTHRLAEGRFPVVAVLALVCGGVIALWAERALWVTISRLGTRADRLVLAGMHLALALGVVVVYLFMGAARQMGYQAPAADWRAAMIQGGTMGATYMGLVALARVLALLLREVLALRWRRIYAIAWHTVIESSRRMWAPYVVIAVFLVILAFTNWFLHPPRIAELGRLYVGTLALLCSMLLMVMVAILTPISLPHDIQQQTIYTVVSKPVRRLELVWGRILGFMAIVSVLLLLFYGVSLAYLWREVQVGTIDAKMVEARKAEQQGRKAHARLLREQIEQLRSRMSARVPIKGSLTFIDSRGAPRLKGIDVGQELEYRSHVEGATQATAIWQFGIVEDPIDKALASKDRRHVVHLLDRRVPVDSLLRPGTIEDLGNRLAELRYQEQMATARQQAPNLPASEGPRLAAQAARAREQAGRLQAEHERLRGQAAQLEQQGKAAEAAALHSPAIPVEMTFTVYRTTKGVIGEPVLASLKVTNPHSEEPPYTLVFPIREYYINRQAIPASLLAGSRGDLRIEVKCISPTQYLGMAESDLYILAQRGTFGLNFAKGLIGIWLQALVLTAIGVWAGTFLSWPVALLTTVAFFVAGQVAFGFLQEFALQTLQGGGPFESLIRLLTHDNLQNELAPTLAVVTAKTFDAVILPVMARLVYVVPNFSALDVSNTVADGFAVTADQVLGNGLIALAYAIPFSVAGYFILKNREVAA